VKKDSCVVDRYREQAEVRDFHAEAYVLGSCAVGNYLLWNNLQFNAALIYRPPGIEDAEHRTNRSCGDGERLDHSDIGHGHRLILLYDLWKSLLPPPKAIE
jgi:hypothetical protein